MEIPEAIRTRWHEEHTLSRREVTWLHQHGDPGDTNPIFTAIALLRTPVESATAGEPPSTDEVRPESVGGAPITGRFT
jgi:hypothetical protein